MIDEVLSICSVFEYNEEWLLDSGASHHICPHKYWFASYQTVNDGIVLLGDNHSCKTVGVGSVKIKMFDGVIRTLTYFRHVLELKKNLISLGVLDSYVHNFTGFDGTLKVSKGALVVMKAHRTWNLYKLVGRIQVNGIALVSEEESGSTELWHQRLGHMSEKGLQVLMNRKLLPNSKTLAILCFVNIVYMESSVDKPLQVGWKDTS